MKKYSILAVTAILALFYLSGIFGCSRNQNSQDRKNQLNSLLLNQALGDSSSPCSNFASSEIFCVANPDSILQTCSNEEFSRLRTGIEPPEKRTDETMNLFFLCWRGCNLIFNSTESICTSNAKFPSNRAYREAQKSGATAASQNWGICMNSCNKGESQELTGSGATYPRPGY